MTSTASGDVRERAPPAFEGLADREAEQVDAGLAPAAPDFDATPPPPVSDAARQLIVRHETGGRPYYDKVIKARPVWPGGASGVTIGFGYDVGYNAPADLRRDWAVLGGPALSRLTPACDRHGDPALAALASSLLDVSVPWEMAETVFHEVTLPRYARLTAGALPDVASLSPDSFGALVSLTFNRGASYSTAWNPAKDPHDRYREMRAIKAAMAAGRLVDIPDLIRAMTRLWRGASVEAEMTRRRTNEAALFAYGLQVRSTPFAPTFDLGAGPAAGDDVDAPDGAEFSEEPFDFAPAIAAAAVRWPVDAESPDYAHIVEGPPQGGLFALDAAGLTQLARANGFPVPAAGRVLFGLRGCAIVDGAEEFEAQATLRDIRPDHQTARCVLGVWDVGSGGIAVFPGSTVPNAAALVSWRARRDKGNLLPTGFYGYIVGVHNGKPGCFLLRKSPAEYREVVVRRSSADLSYTLDDLADDCGPGDNLHPTFFESLAAFSSVGCQTVVGVATPDGEHRGPWARFRSAAGQSGASGAPGTAYGYMLLTGAEAALARTAPPRRLRFGSSGDRVRALQAKLGLASPDGDFGPRTSMALHRLQRSRTPDRSDGVYSPALDAALGWSLLAA